MLCILNVGTVPTLCILYVGTVPMLCILNVGTVPTFSHSLSIFPKNLNDLSAYDDKKISRLNTTSPEYILSD